MILSLVNQKGGVGKTTLAVNLASCRAREGNRVLVVDGDPQGSLLQWQTIAGNRDFDVLHRPGGSVHRAVRSLSRGYDHVVIDCPPSLGDITRSVLRITDLAVVPVGPSPLDIWSSRETVEQVRASGKVNRRLKAILLISRKISRTRIAREAREALAAYAVPVCRTEISQRIAYVEAMLAGQSVLTHAPRSPAAAEMRSLCGELF